MFDKTTINKYLPWFLLGLILCISMCIRSYLLSIPLERDEGEYALMGQLILKGIAPYKMAYNMKFPGTYYMYAIIMSVFGQSVDGIHRGFILVNLITIVFVFLIAKKLIGNFAAIIAAATFSLLTINYGVYGNAAHATHFVLLFALPGLLILLNSDDKSPVGRFLLAGLLIGLAPVMKQSGIFLLLFAASFLVLRHRLQHKTFFSKQGLIQCAYFCGGAVLPILLMLLTIYLSGCWTVFKFWSFDYAALYGNKFSLSDIGKILNNLTGTFQFVVNGWYLVWGIAIIGLIVLFVHKELKDPSKRLFLILLFVFSFISIWPGYLFRNHYFIVLFPSVAILFAVTIDYLKKLGGINKSLAISLFVIALFIGFIEQTNVYFTNTPQQISSALYPDMGFGESETIGSYLKTHSSPQDKIAVFGSEPQIYFFADRLPATGYIYTFGIMELQKYHSKMKEEMIQEITASNPNYFVVVNTNASWFAGQNAEPQLFNWAENYLHKHNFKVIGFVQFGGINKPVWRWNTDAQNYYAHRPYIDIFSNTMVILKR